MTTVEDVLRTMRAEGKRYTKSKYVAERLGKTSKKVAQEMKSLERQGKVEKWGTSGGAATWRILIEP